MIAVIWYWWIGLILIVAGVVAVIALVGGYAKTVTAAKYPSGKQKRED